MDTAAFPSRRLWTFALLWAVATTAAFALSGVAFHFPGAFPPNNRDSVNPDGIFGALINGTLTGVLVGGLQALLLRIVHHATWRWFAGSTAALLLVHTIGDVLPDVVALPLMMGSGGLILGLAQWWAQHWPTQTGLMWTAGTATAWPAGMWLGAVLSADTGWWAGHLAAGLTTGILVGTATGAAWYWLLGHGHRAGAARLSSETHSGKSKR